MNWWGCLVITFIFPVEGHFSEKWKLTNTNFYILPTYVLATVIQKYVQVIQKMCQGVNFQER